MVTHLVDGWVCRDVTPEAIADGLSYFLSEQAHAHRAGDEARRRERAFNHERFAAAWAHVFAIEPALATASARARTL